MTKAALVTGAGQGIGLAVCHRLVQAGYALVVNDIEPDRLEQCRADLESAGAAVIGQAGDVADAHVAGELAELAISSYGGLDACVANAGISPKPEGNPTPALRMSDDEWQRVVAVNLSGAFWTAREAARRMRPGGGIVFMSSLAARTYVDFVGAHYHATKGALVGLTHALAGELAANQIRVNAVAPGRIRTPLATQTVSREVNERFLEQVPLGEWGDPEDVASAIAFLLGDEAGYLTGVTIDVNGGVWMS